MAHSRISNTFRWQAGCACCESKVPCLIFTDGFSGTTYPAAWNEISGTWFLTELSLNQFWLRTNDANAMTIALPENPTAYSFLRVGYQNHMNFSPSVNKTRLFCNVNSDGSEYFYGEIQWGFGQSTFLQVGTQAGPLDTTSALPDQGIPGGYIEPELCFYNGSLSLWVRLANGGIQTISAAVADNGHRQAGIGTGDTLADGVSFDYFAYNIHRQPGYEDCPACPVDTSCSYCSPGTEPSEVQLEVLLEPACSGANGTFILPRVSNCRWELRVGQYLYSAEVIDFFGVGSWDIRVFDDVYGGLFYRATSDDETPLLDCSTGPRSGPGFEGLCFSLGNVVWLTPIP